MITGASSGIGRELALAIGSRPGAVMAISGRRKDGLEEVSHQIVLSGGPPPAVIVADLSRRGAAEELAEAARTKIGPISLLINNAGTGGGGLQWAGADRDEVREIFEVNVWSPLALVSAIVPSMRKRGRGVVVNVTSIAQVSTWPFMGHYTASKAALASLTQTLELELVGTGVHVMEVIPGPIDTPVQGESRLIAGFEAGIRSIGVGSPAVLAEMVVRGIEKRKRRVVYPPRVRPIYTLPGLVRLIAPRRVEKSLEHIDRDDERIRRSGSQGDEFAREARAAWARGERDFASLRERAARSDAPDV